MRKKNIHFVYKTLKQQQQRAFCNNSINNRFLLHCQFMLTWHTINGSEALVLCLEVKFTDLMGKASKGKNTKLLNEC